MNFYQFKKDVESAISKTMNAGKLFTVDVDKDYLWDVYLSSFDDPVVRQEHNCNACKAFIRHLGKVVSINPGTYQTETFWDNVNNSEYKKTTEMLAKAVKDASINSIFLYDTSEYHGCDHNVQHLVNGSTRIWRHLYIEVPVKFRFKSVGYGNTIGEVKGNAVSTQGVFKRSVRELTDDSVDTVIGLIEDNLLYRGAEFLKSLQELRKIKKLTASLNDSQFNNYCWLNYDSPVAKIRNTAIGTLLIDLSEGKDLEVVVKSYETIMAPANYKRPSALITKKQIEEAQKTVEALGLTDSLPRRHAHVEDISVNDVLFVNRDTRKRMKDNVFDMLSSETTVNTKEYSKAEAVSVEDFVSTILPKATSVQVLVENRHAPNFVTLTAPVNKDAKPLFKWNNNFAWVYNGSVADSIKEKVKAAGGRVDGFLRCSLHWFNYDDLDIHVLEPRGGHIFFGSRCGLSGGVLDVDMNAGRGISRDAVENVVWSDPNRLVAGTYTVFVNQYLRRESVDVGFEVEIEINGEIYKFNYPKRVDGNVEVAKIKVDGKKNITIVPTLNEGSTSVKSIKEWSIDTMKFQEVSCIMWSPNYWDGNSVGNKHLFFMIEGCKNPDPVRGFFNEYLRSDLESKHKRVFEAIGSKARVEYSDDQLSGIGFSTTQRNDLIVKVNNKPFKIVF